VALTLYMDHHVPKAITNGLRARNIHVITAHERWRRSIQRSAIIGQGN